MRLFWFFSFVIFISCVSDPQNIPPQISEDPVFGLNAEIDGIPVRFEAGVDGYFLETGWGRDSSGVPYTESRLEKQDCGPGCGPSVSLRMFGISDGVDAENHLVNILQTGEKEFSGPAMTPDSVEVSFAIQLPANQPPAYYWHTPSGSSPFYAQTVTSLYALDEKVSICLNTLANENCFSTKCIDFTPASSPDGCDVSLMTRMLPDSFLLIEAIPAGEPPFVFDWQFGSSVLQSDRNKIIVRAPIAPGRALIQVDVTDATGCTAHLKQMIEVTPVDIRVCPLNMTYAIKEIPGMPNSPFAKAELEYTDADGKSYSSSLYFQDEEAYFSILSVSPYHPNPAGEPTKLLSLDISCKLFDPAENKEVLFSTNEFHLGAAFPGE